MWKAFVNIDLRNLPKILFLLALLFYPIVAFVTVKSFGAGVTPTKVLGLVCLGFLLYRIIEIYRTGSNISIPYYVLFFGLFAAYTLFCSMYFTDHFAKRGSKYFYSDPIWLTLIALIIVENTKFSLNALNLAKKVLGLMLFIAAIVSIIQISDPLFFRNDDLFVKGLSPERMEEYYKNATHLSSTISGNASRFLDGYRLSIFSYINELSVGIDTIAIFSILIALKPLKLAHSIFLAISAALVSFLSSSRWIMLGFMVASSQFFWASKKKLINFIYFLVFSILLLLVFWFGAVLIDFNVEKFFTERLMSDSASTRFLAFEVFFEVFPDSPIFGTGGEDTEEMIRLLGGRSSQIHVGYLKLFYYYGLIGGILYISFMIAILVRLRKMAKFSNYWGGFFAVITFFIANLTLYELSLFYFGPLLALIFANHYYDRKMKKRTMPEFIENATNSTLN